MNSAVFLGLLSGKPLFTKTFGQSNTRKGKKNSPKKLKTKQTPKQSNKNPQPLQNRDLIHGTTTCGAHV